MLGNSTLGFRSPGASLASTALSPAVYSHVATLRVRTIRAKVGALGSLRVAPNVCVPLSHAPYAQMHLLAHVGASRAAF
eukprot:3754221-Alexandrium_andersonii.AAC.1